MTANERTPESDHLDLSLWDESDQLDSSLWDERDHMHPKEAGYKVLAETLAPIVAQMLRARSVDSAMAAMSTGPTNAGGPRKATNAEPTPRKVLNAAIASSTASMLARDTSASGEHYPNVETDYKGDDAS